MKELVFHAKRLHDLDGIAVNIIKAAGNERILAFYGQMGVGKTTLIRTICRGLDVITEVTSPTFALVNEYPSDSGPVFHFDFYRVNRISEALDFGVDEYFDSGRWCLIEWPEKVEELLPETVVRVLLHENPDGSRTIRVKIPA
ncbi:MAG: tRNA (adenosine(37)-N6)-threonylcarbamoyltransferase complex ATPase subunit type 1 TsaE [Porphyromonadaceae bacterium]|nr:MAG: tRNA (adenosine(37)-N6)-threonylcarbamoyltransferase complex ATPase subunit type 1 TsaE [Porphyromonadaceae bacterium]